MSDNTTLQVKNKLQESIVEQVKSLAPGVPSIIVKEIAESVSDQYSPQMVRGIDQGTNLQLNTIPKNIEGSVNPVNLTNANNGPKDIFNNLQGIIQSQYSSNFSNDITNTLVQQLRNSLQPNQLNNINFQNLNNKLNQLISPAVKSSVDTALNNSLTNTFNRNVEIPSYLSGSSTFFNNLSSEGALEQLTESFNISTATQALSESQKFSVNYTENNEKLEVLNKGFTDPEARYPTKEYSGISETNKLAQGDVRGTVVQTKNNERMLGAKLPYGQSWDQPESPYRGQYPYNKVTQTEQGHIIEVDDTPGSERLHIYHRSGTFVEIDANGSIVKRAKGSSYEIIDRNGKIAIAGSADVSINGACNIFVGNDANIEVEGDVNLTCHNDITAQAGGTLNMSAKEEVNITSSVINLEAYDALNLKANAAVNIHSSNVVHMHSNADIKVQALGSYYLKSDLDLYIQSLSALHIKGTGDINIDTDGKIYLNSDTADPSIDSYVAGSSNIGVLSGRKDIADNRLADPQPLTLADNKSLLLEEETQDTENYNQHKNVIISSGYANASTIDQEPVSLESDSPVSSQGTVVHADVNLKKVTMLPGNYNLSTNFTVEMLSSKAAVTKDIIVAQAGLSYGEIIFNLQSLALNVLEPVKKVYPNMFVTSAFRSIKNASNSSTSQHPKGMAADIQFKGASKEDYYDLAIKIAKFIKYDQLILEYCNYTKNPWIHISFSEERNKEQVLTFFNHKKHSYGLSNLA